MSLKDIVENIDDFTDESILNIVKQSQNPNELFFTEIYGGVEMQNILNICAFHKRIGILKELVEAGCKPHIATRHSKNPMIETLFLEDVEYAKNLLNLGYFIFYDESYDNECIFRVDDPRFEHETIGYIDVIDALFIHHKFRSLKFIKDTNESQILRKRDKKTYYTYYNRLYFISQ